ncbi:MAG: TIGR03087 family PEP-CTERM/XrtA system glycosyltransferase [Rhodospirillales bacterium]
MKPPLLFLIQRLPYPPTKGEKIRALQIFMYLSQWYEMHLGCLLDDPADAEHVDTMRAMCASAHIAPLNRRVATLLCLRGLLTGDALSVAYFQDRGLRRWVRDVMTRVKPAMVFVYSSNMAPYVLDLPRSAPLAIDLVDVDSEKWRAYADALTGPKRWVFRREWHKVAALEQRIGGEADMASFVSDAEAALYETLVPNHTATVLGVSNGVDHRYFDPVGSYAPVYDTAVPNYVFTGTMDYKPNADAVVWFATEILPIVRRTLPKAQFHIVGHSPNDAVLRLGQIDGVHVTGRVPDVRPYVAHATASVAPMRIARGIQNKVLEAMSLGRPVVVTSGALEGIDAVPGKEVLLADDADAFAAACVALASGNSGPAIGQAARDCVLQRYDWSACLSRYDAFLRPAENQQ